MSLLVQVISLTGLKVGQSNGERYVKLNFRNTSKNSTRFDNKQPDVNIDQIFHWRINEPLRHDEMISLDIMAANKYLTNRTICRFQMLLQELVDCLNLEITDSLVDCNSVQLKANIRFRLTYTVPEVAICSSVDSSDVSQTYPSLIPGVSDGLTTPVLIAAKSPKMKILKSKIMRFGKQRPPSELGDDLEMVDGTASENNSQDDTLMVVEDALTASDSNSVLEVTPGKLKLHATPISYNVQKPADYQVCITIIEARQLTGLNMDPLVCVQVDNQKRYTSVKESTNTPYYNEYFVFDFHMTPSLLFDKMVTISVLHSRNLLRTGTVVGQFKLDIGTIYTETDHQFYHKWAMLIDPSDVSSGAKGYVKCDISVVGKGDTIKTPPKCNQKDDDDIEINLLLPEGVPPERQRAKYTVKIYKADGIPHTNTGLMANVRRAFSSGVGSEGSSTSRRDFVDPFVQVSFCGHKNCTSVKSGTYEPVWNEAIVFTEMFPPLCRRLKLQLLDADSVTGKRSIGTHHIDLMSISSDGANSGCGFAPTFGPAWINLYGATRAHSLMGNGELSDLNEAIGEGVSFRGRILISLRTIILDIDTSTGSSNVELEQCLPLSESAVGRVEDYFLFSSVMDATMIDRKHATKDIQFEISIGNYGNKIDGSEHEKPTRQSSTWSLPGKLHVSDSEKQCLLDDIDEKDSICEDPSNAWESLHHSVTPLMKPLTTDRVYFMMPYDDVKPCLWLKATYEDNKRRMYNSNIIEKIATKMESCVSRVNEQLAIGEIFPERTLKTGLEEITADCMRYSSSSLSSVSARTQLDKERLNLCHKEMEQICGMSKSLSSRLTPNPKVIASTLKMCSHICARLQQLIFEPQGSLPDVFLWMICKKKRIAYCRLQARDLLYSPMADQKGKLCGTTQTLFLKLPGKKSDGALGWSLQATVNIYLWLGAMKHRPQCLDGIPRGFEECHQLRKATCINARPPPYIRYPEFLIFQMRAHVYQARRLIGSDSSGLSDPFARIIVAGQSQCTQVIDETLSPTWDEMLIFKEVIVYGDIGYIQENPPIVIIEIFDQDKMGKSEYIGRVITHPIVKRCDQAYEKPDFPPSLIWHDVRRGTEEAGQLLSALELLQYENEDLSRCKQLIDLPPLVMPQTQDPNMTDRGPVMPVPIGIRPILSTYRIEILFWGLRSLRRTQFTSVDRPRVDIECAGRVLSSSVIQNGRRMANFNTSIKYFDVELPDNELYCPPITIRCVDCRNFGRFVLVGTHVIDNMRRFMYTPTTKTARCALNKFLNRMNVEGIVSKALKIKAKQVPTEEKKIDTQETVIDIDEKVPLLKINDSPTDANAVNTRVSMGCSSNTVISVIKQNSPKKKEEVKIPIKRSSSRIKRRKCSSTSMTSTQNNDDDCVDWWTKYYASLDTLHTQTNTGDTQERLRHDNSTLCATDSIETATMKMKEGDVEPTPKQLPASNADTKIRKSTFKSTARVVHLASKIQTSMTTSSKPSSNVDIQPVPPDVTELKIYSSELESQPQFHEFADWLHSFPLFRGKKSIERNDEDNRIVGKFKGSINIYKLPIPVDIDDMPAFPFSLSPGGVTVPSNDPVKVLIRVYIVKANDLHPADMNGKADPYICLRLGSSSHVCINDKENYISKQLNPVFGKCFEMNATFPLESQLVVQIYDWDLVGIDDLIGETKIDLENRFYSRHRATCGLPLAYHQNGYNMWRDAMKPTEILSKFCKDMKLAAPTYDRSQVTVCSTVFKSQEQINDEENNEEHLALMVLHRLNELPKVGQSLVPEHVETRSLYNPDKPGIEQGKIEMWVDIFPVDQQTPGPIVDISPRKPVNYELRCIIWNTDDVVLEDDAFFTGEKMSDIYVKGWLCGPEDTQTTDIHYRSLTGEGNFNWRFLLPFSYLIAEEKIVCSRKQTIFSWDETVTKIPARLELQVWDADHFSADDFLGALTLDLNCFPRGAKSSKQCTLSMLKQDGSVPQMSIFKQKRVKGWWPFHVKNELDELELTGKVEAEFHLLTAEEAEKHPVGIARNEPEPLDKPNRPDASFMWFLNPLKSLRYILWHNYKYLILKIIVIILLTVLFGLFLYAAPGYMVKRALGA